MLCMSVFRAPWYATCTNLPLSSLSTDIKLIEAHIFQHIIITLQDKHLIPEQYRTKQIISGLILPAAKWDDIELDYAIKWGVHANWK